MAAWKKWVFKRPKIGKSFKGFRGTVKNVKHLRSFVSKNDSLRRVISKVFTKKGLVAVTAATVVGVGVSAINDYIQSNSGCFLKSENSVCKVKDLSCCQPDPVDELSFCSQTVQGDPCLNFDEDKEKSCCKLCDCQFYNCLPGQEMECRRPTIGEALAHYAQGLTLGAWNWVAYLVPLLYWAAGITTALIVLWIAWKIYKKTRAI